MPKIVSSSIDLGKLQADHDAAKKQWIADEKALQRAQDTRDASKQKYAAATIALRDGTRAVLG